MISVSLMTLFPSNLHILLIYISHWLQMLVSIVLFHSQILSKIQCPITSTLSTSGKVCILANKTSTIAATTTATTGWCASVWSGNDKNEWVKRSKVKSMKPEQRQKTIEKAVGSWYQLICTILQQEQQNEFVTNCCCYCCCSCYYHNYYFQFFDHPFLLLPRAGNIPQKNLWDDWLILPSPNQRHQSTHFHRYIQS